MKRVANALACVRPAGLKRAEWKVKRERDSQPHEIDQSSLRSGDDGHTDRESARHARGPGRPDANPRATGAWARPSIATCLPEHSLAC